MAIRFVHKTPPGSSQPPVPGSPAATIPAATIPGAASPGAVIPSGQAVVDMGGFSQGFLKYHLHKAGAGESAPRSHKTIHISDLDPARNWCPREGALLDMHGKARPMGFLSTAQRVVFDFGHAAASIVRAILPPEKVWGDWKCRACGERIKQAYTPSKCPECGAARDALDYREIFLRDPETGIVGSVDLCVDILSNGQKTIVELKSEGGESFKARSAPEFDHEWRTKGYLYLAARTPWMGGTGIRLDEARILYICKEGYAQDDLIAAWKLPDWRKSPFKEYRVPRDDSAVENQLNKVRSLVEWREHYKKAGSPDGVSPAPLPARACSSASDSRAASCPARKLCFP